ncbi:MAG: ChbG/HpnK family deacetylase [bacterium]
MKRTFLVLFALISLSINAQEKYLIIRCDDIGMSHAVNNAFREIIKTGYPISASVMFPCAWYQEAVDILKENPQISVGVHLTLNAEWKNYRWGSVAGKSVVPSLVDEEGYFFPSRSKFFANNPKLEEVEIELREQINRAKRSGLDIDYLDYHMGTAVDKPELRAIVEKLAKEYNLGISRYFGEDDLNNVYDDPVESKTDSLISIVNGIEKNGLYLLVAHIGKNEPELAAMEDLNPWGPKNMSQSREGELKALCSKEFNQILKLKNIDLIDYRKLIEIKGKANMKSPE